MNRYRKFLVAAIAPLVPVLAHFLHQGPAVTTDAVVYTAIVGELFAFGVLGISNDPKAPAVPAIMK